MSKIIPYNPKLKQLARKLRKDSTFGEIRLWNELKRDKLWGFDFDRQKCIDNYIVDFYCKELMLAIEIDGITHHNVDAFEKDNIRQKKLEEFGIKFIRFGENDVASDITNVIRAIEGVMIEIIKSQPSIKLPKNFDRSLLDY
jgi:very-short-patch-repair endonuclease